MDSGDGANGGLAIPTSFSIIRGGREIDLDSSGLSSTSAIVSYLAVFSKERLDDLCRKGE